MEVGPRAVGCFHRSGFLCDSPGHRDQRTSQSAQELPGHLDKGPENHKVSVLNREGATLASPLERRQGRQGQRAEVREPNMSPSLLSPKKETWAEIPPALSTTIPPVPKKNQESRRDGIADESTLSLASRMRGILRSHLRSQPPSVVVPSGPCARRRPSLALLLTPWPPQSRKQYSTLSCCSATFHI